MLRRVPWTIWSFIVAMVATLAVAALPGDLSMGDPKVAIALTVLWSVLLVRRSSIAWGLLVALYLLAGLLLVGLTAWPWSAALAATIVLVGASLGALLAPPTRRWIAGAP